MHFKCKPESFRFQDIYYEYDETELQHSWPEGWDFVTFYEFRSQYITENRVGGFFDELEV